MTTVETELKTKIYTPILKWKAGEKNALKELSEDIKNKLLPLIEITPDINKEKFSMAEWKNRFFYFDVTPECLEENGGEVYTELLEKCPAKYVIPVLSVGDDLDFIKEIFQDYKNGIAFRVISQDYNNLNYFFNDFSDQIGEFDKVDLIIDLKDIDEKNLNEKHIAADAILTKIPLLKSFRRITIASNAFPKSLAEFDRDKIIMIPRTDYSLYKKMAAIYKQKDLLIFFSDYAVNHHSFLEYVIGMIPSFNIRYSGEDNYIVIRGVSIKKGGLDGNQVQKACKILTNSKYFSGEDFSYGDKYIYDRAAGQATGFGSLTTWRTVGTNHHLTFVVNQLSSLL